jgi:hypothetical protein
MRLNSDLATYVARTFRRVGAIVAAAALLSACAGTPCEFDTWGDGSEGAIYGEDGTWLGCDYPDWVESFFDDVTMWSISSP